MPHRIVFVFAVALAAHSIPADVAAQDVTFDSLLREMVDRRALAEFPEPAYTCGQFSSYDRRSVSPDDPTEEGWFANADAGNFLRYEDRNGRREAVMMDAEGPGAIVRLWSANPKGTLRIYLDHAEQPALEMNMAELLGGRGPVAPPLSAVRARGWNLYLPIPYAEHCTVTTDDPAGMYYLINHRTYEAGTSVETFDQSWLDSKRAQIRRTNLELQSSVNIDASVRMQHSADVRIEPGNRARLFSDDSGGAIALMMLRVDADDLRLALRSCILRLTFDGRETVVCPVGDFFGSAPGLTAYESWPFVINEGGTMISQWFMPYAQSFEMSIENLGEQEVSILASLGATRYAWNDRSMHFAAGWRIERDIPTRPMRDFNYINLSGRGVYVGDALYISNPVEEWWGEGDEKIYIDGESFPSHFGTGTEDYYGYAWCSSEVFNAPLHNQPRCDGPRNYGHTAVNRFRALDAIPFNESLRFDMEIWHWVECTVSYAVVCYWYEHPADAAGSTHNLPPITPEMVLTIPDAPPLPPPFRIEGAVEGEDLDVTARSPDIVVARQQLWKRNTYSGDAHLWVQGRKAGDFVEVRVPVENPGSCRVMVHMTKSWDYGIVVFSIDGRVVGEPLDTFNAEARDLGATGPIDLGEHDLGESFILRIEVTGTNRQSEPPHFYFGLDAVVVE